MRVASSDGPGLGDVDNVVRRGRYARRQIGTGTQGSKRSEVGHPAMLPYSEGPARGVLVPTHCVT